MAMGFNFTILDSENFCLNYVIYVIQCFGCIFSLIPLVFVLHCWLTRPILRTRRTIFTLYLSAIDSVGRLIFFAYYVIRLLTLDNKFTISDYNCNYLAFFLYNASAWPLTSVILLQLHTFFASVACAKYEKWIDRKFCVFTMILSFIFDLIVAVLSQNELHKNMVEKNWYDLIDDCKFEYFSRYSSLHCWKIFIELLIIGVLFLCQCCVVINKQCGRKADLSNPVANSPFHQWETMSKREKIFTISLQICGGFSFLMFIFNYIVFLTQGNSDAERVLTLSITVIAFVGPLEMLWFNVDIRDAFLRNISSKGTQIQRSMKSDRVPFLNCCCGDSDNSEETELI